MKLGHRGAPTLPWTKKLGGLAVATVATLVASSFGGVALAAPAVDDGAAQPTDVYQDIDDWIWTTGKPKATPNGWVTPPSAATRPLSTRGYSKKAVPVESLKGLDKLEPRQPELDYDGGYATMYLQIGGEFNGNRPTGGTRLFADYTTQGWCTDNYGICKTLDEWVDLNQGADAYFGINALYPAVVKSLTFGDTKYIFSTIRGLEFVPAEVNVAAGAQGASALEATFSREVTYSDACVLAVMPGEAKPGSGVVAYGQIDDMTPTEVDGDYVYSLPVSLDAGDYTGYLYCGGQFKADAKLTITEVPLTEVTPVAPVLGEAECGVEPTVTIPEVEGVEYTQTRDGDLVTVTATAKEGYVIAENAPVEWIFSVAAEPCPVEKAERLSGPDRYATSLAALKDSFEAGQVLFVATGSAYPDALSAGPAAVREGGALVLTPAKALRSDLKSYLQENTPSRIYVLGGWGAVSDNVVSALAAIAPTERVYGADRYETSDAIFTKFFSKVQEGQAYVATGEGFSDALTASAAAGSVDGPVLLVKGANGTRGGLAGGPASFTRQT